jgi:hypothetical protein
VASEAALDPSEVFPYSFVVETDGRLGRAYRVAVLALAALSCGKRRAVESSDASTAAVANEASVAGSATAASSRAPRPPVPPAPATSAAVFSADGGNASCKFLGGPTLQTFNGPALLRMAARAEGEVAELVYNEGGSPRLYDARVGDAGARGPLPAKSPLPPCAAVQGFFYCPDASGAIHKSRGPGEDDTVVAKSHAGTRIAASSLSGRPLVAYITDRITSEGLVREAWAALDGAAPVRVSEDGSGATFVDLAPRGDGLVVLTIDARVAMTPAHARPLTLDGDKLVVGKDAVIFVGGSAERHNAGTLATSQDGTAFGLIPVSEDGLRFGMAAIRIDDPPVDDANVVWSFYPNGLDPAAVAATRGEGAIYVARVRPRAPETDATHVLEIGVLEPNGAFRSPCIAAESTFVKDLEIAKDRQKGLWVFYRTASGSWLVRVAAT